jgi:transposase
MSAREPDGNYLGELALERRQLKAELKAHRLQVVTDHLLSGYGSSEIAARLRVSRDIAARLIAQVKRGQS